MSAPAGPRTGTPSVLFAYPWLGALGGAELVAGRILRWLFRAGADVTILALAPAGEGEVARFAGMAPPPGAWRVEVAPGPPGARHAAGRAFLLRVAFLHRAARRRSGAYDLCVSAYSEMDFGRAGFQYVHHPLFAPKRFLARYDMVGTPGPADRIPAFDLAQRAAVRLVTGGGFGGCRRNTTVVNSEFIRECVREVYGVDAAVVYPGVLPGLPERPDPARWEEREFRFVAVGRISPDKRYPQLVEAFAPVARAFPAARLVIVGHEGDRGCAEEIRDWSAALGVPLEVHTNVPAEELRRMLQTSRYYVHSKPFEHFGISIVEAAAHGCLPLVPDSGGQTEIVRPPLLRYRTGSDLVRAVETAERDPVRRCAMLDDVWNGLGRFTEEQFMAGLDVTLGRLLRDRGRDAGGANPDTARSKEQS